MADGWLPFDEEPATPDSRLDAIDRDGRARAVDPRFNVALEASAGTGKTRVLVDRYVNLLREGVDPSEILALTFTRKAAAEMRDRIVTTLKTAAARGEIRPARWRELRDRTADVAINTIDAFCLSLLREFPLEADLDPGFQVADETEVPRLIDEALDRALRTCRSVAREDEHVALVFAQLGDRRARAGLASLLARRIVAPAVLSRYLASGPRDLTLRDAATRGARRLLEVFDSMRGGLERLLETGPRHPSFRLLAASLQAIGDEAALGDDIDPVAVQSAFRLTREHFLTQDGEPRKAMQSKYKKATFASPLDQRVHRDMVVTHAAAMREAYTAFRRDLNALVSRGVWRMFRIAEAEYRRTLDAHALLDYPDILLKALELLRQMEEFAQSRFRLESRYHHVLVDEFQDTSRAQWELISLLIQAWGEGAGLAHTGALAPTIFIVGDRKQSIYGFRDADVSLLREAGQYLDTLRPGGDTRRSISRSFRSVRPLLAFVNDLCDEVAKLPGRHDGFVYDEQDRFPIDASPNEEAADALGIVAGETLDSCAIATADEIVRLIADETLIRDRDTGIRRPIRPADIAILFRTRESHREYERALEDRGIPVYVYKGLGFFDADEIQDVLAVLWYLADPVSDLRASAWLRSRFVRLSDEGLRCLSPRIADALASSEPPAVALDPYDADVLAAARDATRRWRPLVDRIPPAELIDLVLEESAYAFELRGPRLAQARENLKKIRGMICRMQNRGYRTLERIVTHLEQLAVGDEANAVIDASDAVSLMTVHGAKGLEFPVVFIVNMSRGTGNWRDAIRIAREGTAGDVSVAVGDFESAADEDEPVRDREETKRLLYVALTRARDRLYLGSVVKDGRFQAGRGSLGEVLPPVVQNLFVEAAAGAPSVQWNVSGRSHVMRARVPDSVAVSSAALSALMPEPEPGSDYAALADEGVPRTSASAHAGVAARASDRPPDEGRGSSRLAGIVVHRLLRQEGAGTEATDEQLYRSALAILGTLPASDVDDIGEFIADAVARFRALAAQPELRELYLSGRAVHEVPFTMAVNGRFVRGTIDCLVVGEGQVTVLEFKTGRSHAAHEEQASVYRAAAQGLFPSAKVDSRVIYAAGS